MSDGEEDEIYVYLDFNEKLPSSIFQNKFFLRVANLEKPNPLVQLNDQVFKGTYDESIGTNLFFDEIENPPLKSNVFEKETPIRLQYALSQTKILKLKQAKLPKNVSTKNTQEFVDINLRQDYKKTLDKLEQGTLNLEDLVQYNRDEMSVVNEQIKPQSCNVQTELKQTDNVRTVTENKSSNALLMEKYQKLKRLARIPVRSVKIEENIVEKLEDNVLTTPEGIEVNKSNESEEYVKFNESKTYDLTKL